MTNRSMVIDLMESKNSNKAVKKAGHSALRNYYWQKYQFTCFHDPKAKSLVIVSGYISFGFDFLCEHVL